MQLNPSYYTHGLVSRRLFEVYFLLGLRTLTIAMIGIFLPLYLLNEVGLPFASVVTFYLIMTVTFGLALFPATMVISRYGSKRAILTSYLFLGTGLLVTLALQSRPDLRALAALAFGINMALFWMGFHIDAALYSRKKVVGKQVALIHVAETFGIVLGPLIGGVIAHYFGFTTLFILAFVIMGISVIPILFSKEVYAKTEFDIRYFFRDGHTKYFFGYIAQGIQFTSLGVFWPIFIFTILGGYLTLGIYGTIVALIVAVLGYIIGNIADEYRKGKIIKIAAIADGILWIFRPFVSTIPQLFTVGVLGGTTRSAIDIPLLAKTYNRARREQIATFILFREISLRLGEVTVLVLVLLFANMKVAFITSTLAAVLYFLF